MNYQHKDLAEGRWAIMPFLNQMANIGSEVERALSWKKKNNASYCQQAFERALELVDLTVESASKPSYFRELLRMREAMADYFQGQNQFRSSDKEWREYFLHFSCAARKNH